MTRVLTHEQQALLDLCARVEMIEARLGLRTRHGPSALPELGNRVWLAEVATEKQPLPFRSIRTQFRSRRRLLPAAQFNSRRSA
jgi:hypothetical protein